MSMDRGMGEAVVHTYNRILLCHRRNEPMPCASLVAQKRIRLQCGRSGFDPWVGKILGEGQGYPLQYSGLENSTDCIVLGVAKSRTRLSDFFTLLSATCSNVDGPRDGHTKRSQRGRERQTPCDTTYTGLPGWPVQET